MPDKIPVFYAPGTFKPAACVEDWTRCGLMGEAREFEPASRADLCLAHDPRYVDGVLEGRIRNGFNGTEPDVAASLPYTTGAMMAAAEEVVLNGGFACAPVSGFHRAHYDSAGGFCTFNGLIVTECICRARATRSASAYWISTNTMGTAPIRSSSG